MIAVEIVFFWACVALLVYAHLGYPLVLRGLVAASGRSEQRSPRPPEPLPSVSVIVAAHDERPGIERRVANLLALDYPRELLEVVVASDGSTDGTAQAARGAGADLVLELPRVGKEAALNAAVERARGDVLAFSDANSLWEPDALRWLVARLAEPRVGYVCGRVGLEARGGDNQEGLYWRYEMSIRKLESRLAGVTAGNGGINAVRRETYLFLDPTWGTDLCFPYELMKRGWRSVYEPRARASEPMATTIGDEFGRKRRMMIGAWGALLAGGMLSPRGYGPMYLFEVLSHRLLRYASPILHAGALAANLVLLGEGTVYAATLGAQLGFLAAAALGALIPARPFAVARYYVAVTLSSAVGLWDYLRHGVPATWEKAGGTRQPGRS